MTGTGRQRGGRGGNGLRLAILRYDPQLDLEKLFFVCLVSPRLICGLL